MSKQTAFIIEDDYDASAIFATALQVVGFDTEIIASGEEAVERLKKAVPDLVMLDLHLPRVVGTDILQQIRSDERLKDTLVIIASADARMADMIRADADLVLLKPTTFSQVRDLAARLVKRRKPA